MKISAKKWLAAVALFAGSLLGVGAEKVYGFEPNANGELTDDGGYISTTLGGEVTQHCEPACEADCDCVPKLLGFIAPSDQCFSCFISPMTNPVFFEDPRTLSEVRFIFLNHVIPNRAPLVGGDVQVLAAQVRAALTDRLSIIVTKDGFIFAGADPVIMDDGWADVNLGLKYNLWSDPECQRLLSAGLTYELPIGSTKALQGNGDGLFHLFLTGGTAFSSYGHWISGAGFWLPADSAAESQVFYWSNHWDWQINGGNFYALTEVNWYHYMRSGAGGVPGLEGGDLINLGSTGVAGNDIVTGAIGGKYKPTDYTEIGVAWEVPLTDRRDVLDNRLTVDWIIRY